MFVRPAQLVQTPAHLVQTLGQWHVHSQRVARRNALAASRALAERRRELEEVERFLAARGQARSVATPWVSAPTASSPVASGPEASGPAAVSGRRLAVPSSLDGGA